MSHSPRPWKYETRTHSGTGDEYIALLDANGEEILCTGGGMYDGWYPDIYEDDARDIAACVNACVGVKIEVLEEVMRGEAMLVLGSSEEMREVAQQIARDSNDFEVLCSECGRALPPVAAPKGEKAKEDPKC